MGSESEDSLFIGFARRWSPFKRLDCLLNSVVINQDDVPITELQSALLTHKSDFVSLLTNPPPSDNHRKIVTQASSSGIQVDVGDRNQHTLDGTSPSKPKIILSQEMIDEALLMSQMFSLNELAALELIVVGENHESRYPGLSRGPVAVLLYLDGRRSIIHSLELLTQALSGRSWALALKPEISRIINGFIEDLKRNNIVQTVIDHLNRFDIQQEFELLEKNRALGPSKYRKQVSDILFEIRQSMANIVFNFASQGCLAQIEVERIIQFLSKSTLVPSSKDQEDGTEQYLDLVSRTLLSALLYTLDLTPLQSVQNPVSDERQLMSTTILSDLPLVKERTLFNSLLAMLNKNNFIVPQIKTTILLAWCLSVKTALNYPYVDDLDQFVSELDEDRIIDDLFDNQAPFECLTILIPTGPLDEFQCRRIHGLLADTIALLPLKMKEIRDQGDESGRIVQAYYNEGIQPPADLPRHFEQLLILLSKFYARDNHGLAAEFFLTEKRPTQRSIALNKFLRSLQDCYLPAVLHIPVLKLFDSLAINNPFHVYNMLKSFNDERNSHFSLGNFFTCLNQYFLNVRSIQPISVSRASISNVSHPHTPQYPISQLELDTFVAILQLIETISSKEKNCCMAIAENHQYGAVHVLIGLLMCGIPRPLKASILKTLSGMSKSVQNVAFQVWSKIEVLLPRPPSHTTSIGTVNQLRTTSLPKTWQHGLALEIDDIEPRQEEYDMTISLLHLLSALFDHVNYKDNPDHMPVITHTLDSVISYILLKVHSRSFKHPEQKWEILKESHSIMLKVLSNYDGKSVEKLGFPLMTQILQDQGLFRVMLDTLDELASLLESQMISSKDIHRNSEPEIPPKHLIDTACTVLQVLNYVAEIEHHFISLLHSIPGFPLPFIIRLNTLFDSINPKTNHIDQLATLIRLIAPTSGSSSYDDMHIHILNLLSSLMKDNGDIAIKTLLQLNSTDLSNPYIKDDFLTYHFVEFLESTNRKLRLATLKFLSSGLDLSTSLHGAGLCHHLLGFAFSGSQLAFRIKEPIKGFGTVYNCLHAVLNLLLSGQVSTNVDVIEERVLSIEILYKLSSDPLLSDTILRYLRTSSDLFTVYLSGITVPIDTKQRRKLLELKYFIKILAMEIAKTMAKSIRSKTDSYVAALYLNPSKKLYKLLPDSLFIQSVPDMPQWEFFDSSELMRMITDSTDNARINMAMIREKLVTEVKSLGSHIGLAQGRLIEKEIENICLYVQAMNEAQASLEDKTAYFESLRDLIEVVYTCGAIECIPKPVQRKITFELIHFMLEKLTNEEELITRLLAPISTIILTLASHLHSLSNDLNQNEHEQGGVMMMESHHEISDYVTITRSLVRTLEYTNSIWSAQHNRSRVDLISSLLYMLNSLGDSQAGKGEVSRLSSRLVDRLFTAIMGGHDILKVSSITVLLSIPDSTWMKTFSQDGTLRLILESLLVDDQQVSLEKCSLFSRSFFALETKFTLLSKIASTDTGARVLLHSDLIHILSAMKCIDLVLSQRPVALRMFNSIMCLLNTLTRALGTKGYREMSRFATNKQELLGEFLANVPTLEDISEGREAMRLTTAYLSSIGSYLPDHLILAMMACTAHYTNNLSGQSDRRDNNAHILSNLLLAFVALYRQGENQELKLLFHPSLSITDPANMERRGVNRFDSSPPSMGTLVLVLLKSLDLKNAHPDDIYDTIIESALYLLLVNLTIYMTRPLEDSQEACGFVAGKELEAMRLSLPSTLTEQFFSRIEAGASTSADQVSFVPSLVRRLQRTVKLIK